MAKQTKPSIVFAHGLWADGSCFQKLIPTLQADGHEVMCSQHGLDSLKSDVECVTRCFGRVSAPVVLVGHSYGGTLITHAGTDNRVAALVYIAALAPDETETSQSQRHGPLQLSTSGYRQDGRSQRSAANSKSPSPSSIQA
jgi:pimeloyl-ACP methyl ester carboxylesterase